MLTSADSGQYNDTDDQSLMLPCVASTGVDSTVWSSKGAESASRTPESIAGDLNDFAKWKWRCRAFIVLT